ncbi:MAG: LLM class flavin-dependent oxidoreductase [Segniliparus sp.]|uniref:LLM class flavin-dependent oxidoreductase n=1 Tax=Segniliparus sp. TaxID=2804064 RepID=UPI003F2D349C
MALKVGLLLPSRETAMTGTHDAPGVVRFAAEAEQAGFDSVWVGDSLLARTRAEPLSVLASVAAVTERVEMGTAALIAPLRAPLLGAAQAATVDQLSSGRLVLGVAFGSPVPESRKEFEAVSVPFAGRGKRLDETVDLWRAAWGGRQSFSGDLFSIEDLGGALPPARRGGPPVWLAGGDSQTVVERVAGRYDGWLPYLPDSGAYARAWERISERASREITPALYATVNINDDKQAAAEQLDGYMRAYYRQPLDAMSAIQAVCGGSAQECLDWLARYVEAGARHLILRIGSLDPHVEVLAERLLPALRSLAV